MTDPKNLSDEQLEQRFRRAKRRDDIALLACTGMFGIGVICAMASVFLWPLLPVFLGILGAAQINQSHVLRPCEAEKERRGEIRRQEEAALKAIAEGKSPMAEGVSGAFNPAAATVLESDMRSMAPLRLKVKNSFALYR